MKPETDEQKRELIECILRSVEWQFQSVPKAARVHIIGGRPGMGCANPSSGNQPNMSIRYYIHEALGTAHPTTEEVLGLMKGLQEALQRTKDVDILFIEGAADLLARPPRTSEEKGNKSYSLVRSDKPEDHQMAYQQDMKGRLPEYIFGCEGDVRTVRAAHAYLQQVFRGRDVFEGYWQAHGFERALDKQALKEAAALPARGEPTPEGAPKKSYPSVMREIMEERESGAKGGASNKSPTPDRWF